MDPIRTIDDMNSFFDRLKKCDNWSLYLLKITSSKKMGVLYYTRQIMLAPEGKLCEVVSSICKQYMEGEYSLKNKFERIEEYDGVNIGNIIYRLPTDSEMICAEFNALIGALNDPGAEGDLKPSRYNGYVINGRLADDEPIRLISLQNPITSYEHKHRFFCDGSSFKEITGNVLQLKSYVDAIIFKEHLYMMNLNAEKLFDMERSYKKKCEEEAQNIVDQGIVSDAEAFVAAANSGHNPRKFISFNQRNLELLAKSKKTREKIGEKFKIPLTTSGTFDTTDKKNSDNLVKILCNKAMLEPFGQEPMEVEAARVWS